MRSLGGKSATSGLRGVVGPRVRFSILGERSDIECLRILSCEGLSAIAVDDEANLSLDDASLSFDDASLSCEAAPMNDERSSSLSSGVIPSSWAILAISFLRAWYRL